MSVAGVLLWYIPNICSKDAKHGAMCVDAYAMTLKTQHCGVADLLRLQLSELNKSALYSAADQHGPQSSNVSEQLSCSVAQHSLTSHMGHSLQACSKQAPCSGA